MFIARFLTGPGTDKTPHNVRITFFEYLHGKVNSGSFLINLGIKYDKNLLNDYYFIGVELCL